MVLQIRWLASAQAGIPPRLRVAFFPRGPARTHLSGILLVVQDLLPHPPRNVLPPIA